MLGAVDRRYLFSLAEALADADGTRLMREAAALAERSIGFDGALAEMALLWHQIAMAQTVPAAIADDEPERELLFSLASRIAPEDVQLYYQIALHGRRDLALAPDELAGFSMTLLRMLAFHPAHSVGSGPSEKPVARGPAARQTAGQSTPVASVSTPLVSEGASTAKVLLAKLSGRTPSRTAPSSEALADPAESEPEPEPRRDEPVALAHSQAEAQEGTPLGPDVALSKSAPPVPWESDTPIVEHDDAASELALGADPAGHDPQDQAEPNQPPTPFDGDWMALIAELGPRMGAARMLAQNAVLKSFDGKCLALAVPENFRHLAARDYQDKLKGVLAERFADTLDVVVSVEDLGLETPAMRDARFRQTQLAAARVALEEDPVVQQFVRDFDATLLADTIQPVQES